LEQLRVERTRRREQDGTVNINISTADRSGRKVITAKDVSFAYDEPIVSSLTTTIMRGDRIGVIGPNGCGKTTLLNILLGRRPPDRGTVEHGTNLEIVYFDQHREQLMEDRDVLYNVSNGNEFVQVDGSRRHAIGYLKDFLFSPDRIRQPVSSLSGGERNRLLLARLFTRPSNVLVLDEPTNDLDLETLEMLEARLLDYPGTVLLVSHDRSFLDNLCTSCFVFEGKGVIKEYVGGYSDWQRVVQRRDTPAAKASPKKATPAQSQAPSHQQKLTNKEREELKKLPGRIEQLEAELEELQQHMADPEFFKGPADEVKSVSRRIAELPGAIEQAYTRWTELEQRPS
jgi:ATP-binding cassette subfamily F protein uup